MRETIRSIQQNLTIQIFILIQCIFISFMSFAQSEVFEMNTDNWQLMNGQFVEHMGRNSLSGTAMLKNVEFENGIIEYDLAVSGVRSYPGVRFRVHGQGKAEDVYIRPHLIGEPQDAVQYTPVYHSQSCWQLYNDDGFTTPIQIPLDAWVHVKLEISGSQARVYIGDTKQPTLEIDYLLHGISKGGIVLNAPPDGSAYFSNFKIDATEALVFEPALEEETPQGMITDWEISRSFRSSKVDLEKAYDQQGITDIEWQKVASERSGLVNISSYVPRTGREPDFVFARTFIESDVAVSKQYNFGYSDWVTIFLNGDLVYSGSSPYRGRGAGFPGIIGLFDTINLQLKKGKNELVFLVGETFGGWGIMCQDAKAVFLGKNMVKQWETDKVFSTSESVLHDPKREVLYVSNFDQYNMGNPNARQFISKVSLAGEVIELKWMDNLNNPLGMTIYKDQLFVAERNGIAVIDPDQGVIMERYPVEGSAFLNDIAIDDAGNIYISDSRKNVIWKYANGSAEEWLTGEEVIDPNVLYYFDGKLFYGNSGDQSLKTVDPSNKNVHTIATFEKGFIDGFRIDENGNYLVSLWKGKLYRVTPDGFVAKILDTTTPGDHSADFEYIKEKKLLLIPTFLGNTVSAYKMG